MSYEISLIKSLENRDSLLHSRLNEIREKANELMTFTQGTFPFYTPHDFHHSRNVEENLNWLIPDQIKEKMNTTEIFFLIISAWFHDWGMVGQPGEDSVSIREMHHIRTEKNFNTYYQDVNLTNHESMIVGRICKGHRKVDLNTDEFDDILFKQDIVIRRRFLAALLRIADECDITSNRTPEIIYHSINPSGVSKEEFEKHLTISGIGQFDEPHKIYISAIARDPKGAETLREVRENIQKELDSVKSILGKYGIPLDIIELKLETRGFIDKPIGFNINKTKIVELLIGEHLYENPDVAIRELIQNSIDTCKFKKIKEIEFIGKVIINKIKDNMIIIEDNGYGMGFYEAKNFLSNIGSSFYTSIDIQTLFSNEKTEPIGQFGIGILSSFLIADGLTIETKKDGEESCRFSIGSIDEDWRYEKGSLTKSGTKITLILNDEGKKIRIKDVINKYVICSDIDIYIKEYDEKEIKYESSWSIDNIFNRLLMDAKNEQFTISPPLIELCNDDYDLFFGLVPNRNIYPYEHLTLYNQGIYVGEFDIKCLSFNHYLFVNIKKNIIDLQISRDDVVRNENWYNLIYRIFCDIFEKLKKYDSNDKKEIFISHIKEIIDSHEYIDTILFPKYLDEYPLMKWFYNYAPIPFIEKDEFSYINLKNLEIVDNVILYQCCQNDIINEINNVKDLLKGERIFFFPYQKSRIKHLKEGKEVIEDYIKYLLNKDNKTFKYHDFRTILLDKVEVVEHEYTDIIPNNVKLGSFPKGYKPFFLLFKKAIVRENEIFLGSSYWGNISLFKSLLQGERKERMLEDMGKSFGRLLKFLDVEEEPITIIDQADGFISDVLSKRSEDPFSESTTNLIRRYFEYLRFLPLVIHNIESAIIFIEVVDNLEIEISKKLGVNQPKPFFNRMEPNPDIYISHMKRVGNFYEVKE